VFGGAVILVFLLLVLVVVGALAVGLAFALRARSDSTLGSELASARRHATTTSGLALTAMLGTPLLLVILLGVSAVLGMRWGLSFGPAFRLMSCLPLLGALLGILVLLLGELTWPRPTGASRTALLHDRSVRSLLTRGWPLWGTAATALTALTLLLAGWAGDDSGATVTHTRRDGAASAGPFPGWSYVGPQLVVLAVCLAAAMGTVLAVARRSAVVTADVETDSLLRRASVARVARALIAGCLVTVGPDLVFGGSAVHRAFGTGAVASAGTAGMLIGVLAVVVGFAALAVPVPRLPALPSYTAPSSPHVSA
jgi:hypothetical protein